MTLAVAQGLFLPVTTGSKNAARQAWSFFACFDRLRMAS